MLVKSTANQKSSWELVSLKLRCYLAVDQLVWGGILVAVVGVEL